MHVKFRVFNFRHKDERRKYFDVENFQIKYCPFFRTECTEGDVRLVNGSVASEGRVEICYYGTWGAVCDYLYSYEEAQVICRQLGFFNPEECEFENFLHSLPFSLTHSLPHSLTHSLSCSLTYSLTHSLTHSCTIIFAFSIQLHSLTSVHTLEEELFHTKQTNSSALELSQKF